MIRDDIKAAQVAAMKSGDKARLGTIRLMLAKIKDKDIELRTGTAPADDDVLVTDVLQKMVKQRRESITMYEQGGRQELADIEAAEVAVIQDFLIARHRRIETNLAYRGPARAVAHAPQDRAVGKDEHAGGAGRLAFGRD